MMRHVVGLLLFALASQPMQGQSNSLTTAEAGELETQLKTNPDNPGARAKLLGFYISQSGRWADGPEREAAGRHILWVVENQPDSPVLSTPAAFLDPKSDSEAFRSATQLWRKISADPQASAGALANAVYFFRCVDRDLAFEIVSRARRRFPRDGRFPRLEGELDVLAVLGVTALDRHGMATDLDNSAVSSDRVKRIQLNLEQTSDAGVLGGAGFAWMMQRSVLFRKGRSEDVRRALDTARSYFERAAKLEPENAQWRGGLLSVYQSMAASEPDATRKAPYLETAAGLARDPQERFLILGDLSEAHANAGQMDRAEAEARQLLELAPQFTGNWNYGNAIHHANIALGRAALGRGDIAKADEYLLAAGRTPGSPQLNSFGPNLKLAEDLLARGESETVLAYLKLCGTFWKMDQGRLTAWADTIRSEGTPQFSRVPGNPVTPPALVGRAAPDFKLRDLQGVEHTLQEFAGKVVLLDFWATWCAPCREEMPLLERIHRESLGKDVAVVAIDAGEDATTVEAFISKGKYTMPILLSAQNEAIAAYRVTAYPTLAVVDKAGKVASYVIGNQGEGALRQAIAAGKAGAPEHRPSVAIRENASAEDLYRLAVRFRREHAYDDCVAALDRAVKLRPEWWMALMLRGDCHYDLKQYGAAILDFDAVARLRPEWALVHLRRGLAYSNSQRHAQAIDDYNAAIQLAPDNAAAFNSRGWAYLEMGNLERSLSDLNRALELNPANQLALENRVKLCMARKEYDKAIADCDALIELNANPAWAQRNRRDAMKAAGRIVPDTPSAAVPSVTSNVIDSSIPAPKLLTPEPGAVFSHFPRRTTLTWEPVPGAVAYEGEVDFQSRGAWASETGLPSKSFSTASPVHEFNFVGAQPGRWRVWAVNADGARGARSEWRMFRYTK